LPVRFSFAHFRTDCIDACEKDNIARAHARLRAMSTMTWQQITQAPREGFGHELIPRDQLTCPCELTKDVVEVLSFRYSASERIIGHREGQFLHILWISHGGNAYPH